MTNLDQFESVFKAADKPVFRYHATQLDSVVVVTDADGPTAEEFAALVRSFLASLGSDTRWERVDGSQYQSVGELLQRVGEARPDLVCLYRNLHIPAREYPHSLGVYVDVLTQASTLPILVMPHPEHLRELPQLQTARRVMAITDHLQGDHRLVSFAAQMTADDGVLYLAHVEDEAAFERFMQVVAKIPSIDTPDAREAVLQRLLKEPADYIESCREGLQAAMPGLQVEKIVTIGHRLSDYQRLIDQNNIDLLVLNTKDEDQLAMHGLAYPLTVELRKTPLLLL